MKVTVDHELLARHFEQHREHLRAVAFRMLGSASEADDAVQEAWLRLSRSDGGAITNLGGWLTTVVARVCLDALRARKARLEESHERLPEPPSDADAAPSQERERLLADSVGLALLVVLERLTPAERLAFVLHDMFAMPFEEIAPVVGKSVAAAKQLASRARRRLQGAPAVPEEELKRQRRTVDAFLAATRAGNIAALLEVLDPDVVVHADFTASVRGADAVGRAALVFSRGLTEFTRCTLVNGAVGLVVAPMGHLTTVLSFTFLDGKIAEVRVFADPSRLRELDLAVLEAPVGVAGPGGSGST